MTFRLITAAIFSVLATASAQAEDLWRTLSAVPYTADPQQVEVLDIAAAVWRDVYEGLTTYAADGSIVPGIAQSWDVSEDGLTHTFHLRDAQWSNGDPVRAQDFVFTFERLLDPAMASPNAYLFRSIEGAASRLAGGGGPIGVAAVDDKTLTIRLASPVPLLLTYLAQPTAAPLYRASVELSEWRHPIVSGPYQISNFEDGYQASLLRNDYYYDRQAVAASSVLYSQAAGDSAAMLFINGAHLSSYDGRPEDSSYAISNAQVFVTQGAPVYTAIINTAKIGNVDVRRAMSATLDRQKLASSLSGGWLPTVSLGTGPNEEPSNPTGPECCRLNPKSCDTQPTCGKEEVPPDVLQWLTGQNLSIVSSQWEQSIRLATEVGSFWDDQANVSVQSTDDMLGALKSDNFDVVITTLWTDTGDAMDQMGWLDQSASKMIDQPEFSSLVQTALASESERAGLLAKAENLLLDQKIVLPLVAMPMVNVVRNDLTGWQPNVENVHLSRYMTVQQ